MHIKTQCVHDRGPWAMDGPIDCQKFIVRKPARRNANATQENRAGEDGCKGPLRMGNAKGCGTALHTEHLMAAAGWSIRALPGATMQTRRGLSPFVTLANS